jgi:uncharacterized protein YdgA (DUF945 family)
VLPKQRLIAAGATLGAVFVLYGGAAYWAGVKAQDTLEEQHRMLASLPFFKVKSHDYRRGWFSSTETTELEFNRRLLAPYETMLPDSVRPLLGKTIKYTQHIKHGPLPGIGSFDLRPARALVNTEFDMSEATRKTLAKFFGDAQPITMINRLGLGGGGVLTLKIPAFDYEETLSGVRVKWQGFDLKVDYASGYHEYQTEAVSPGFLLEASTKGRVAFDGVRYVSDARQGNTGVKLGTSELSVGGVQLNWKEGVPYNIKLNELVYLLTRMRVGEFINPSGEFRPSNVGLKKLDYQMVTSEQEDYINARGKLGFESFNYNQSVYGPLRLDVSANHLHGPTLVKLDKALSSIPFEGVDPAKLRQQYIDAVKNNGIPLLANNPRLVVNDFYLKMPTGVATLKGQLALNGFQEKDLKDPLAFLKRFDAEAAVDVPRQTLENLVVAQARNLFTVDKSAAEQPNLAEIDDLARGLLAAQLDEWSNQHYITIQKGQVATSLTFRNGVLQVNRKTIALPWQEQADASAPAAKAAQAQ